MAITKTIEQLELDVDIAAIEWATINESLRVTRLEYSWACNNSCEETIGNLWNQCNFLEGDLIMAGLKLHTAQQALARAPENGFVPAN